MKSYIKLLCLVMVLSFALALITGCKKDTLDTDTNVETNNGEVAGISPKNYDRDFVILNPNGELYVDYYWAEDLSNASNISRVNYEREAAIEDHLGIQIKHEIFERKDGVLYTTLESSVLAGDDLYQLVLTHCFQNLVNVMSQSYLSDLSQIPSISMNEDYYNNNIMDSVKYQGKTFLGSSSLILHSPAVILFNKEMADSYESVGSDKLYQHVRDNTWTLEQMFSYAKLVDVSRNDTLSNPVDGTYGFVTQIDWEMTSFVAASGYRHVTVDSEGKYTLQGFNENIFGIFQKIATFADSAYFYGWNWGTEGKSISMDSGRAFFATAGVDTMIHQMTNSDVKLGVLPYPTMESGMVAQNLDWAGYFCIPSVIQDAQLSGEVIELLSYYGETLIKHEFYDVLLGYRAAQEIQDTEMLELIFDNLTIEPALAFLNRGSSDLARIFYVVPNMIQQNKKAMSSWYAEHYSLAKKQLEEMNNK